MQRVEVMKSAGLESFRKSQKVTKLEVARRQLHAAITLYFQNGDMVPIHTLIAAAHQVLRDLLKKSGGKSLVRDIDLFQTKQHINLWNTFLSRPQNFFKHADRDPDGELRFYPIMTTFLIFDCAHMYWKLAGKHSRAGLVFYIWFAVQVRDLRKWKSIRGLLKIAPKSAITRKSCLELVTKPQEYPMSNVDE